MFGRCLEDLLKVSARYLEVCWMSFGRCLQGVFKVSRRCMKGVWKVVGKCLEGLWKVGTGKVRSGIGQAVFWILFKVFLEGV